MPGLLTGYGNYSTSTVDSLRPNQVRGTFSPQSNYSGNVDFTINNTTLFSVRGARFWDNYKVPRRLRP